MSSSDESDNDVYQSEEEVTSIVHMCSSNSSSSETLDDKGENRNLRRDSGTGSIDSTSESAEMDFKSQGPRSSTTNDKTLLSPTEVEITYLGSKKDKGSMFQSQSVQVFYLNEESENTRNIFKITEKLQHLVATTGGVIYVSTSFIKDWNASSVVHPDVLCDACVFSNTRPVRLLTFCRRGKQDSLHQYSAEITRHLVTKVRKHMFTNFTVLSGVIEEADCQIEDDFVSKIEKLDSEAKKKYIPTWLYMDESRSRKIVQVFLNLCSRRTAQEDRRTNSQDKFSQQTRPLSIASRRKGSMPMLLPSRTCRDITEENVDRSATLPRSNSEKRRKSASLKQCVQRFLKDSEKLFDKHVSTLPKPKWLCKHDWRRVNSEATHILTGSRCKTSSSRHSELSEEKTHRRTTSTG